MDFGLKGKRAIVMAASRGLGYASALGLAREGCHLVVCSRDQERIEAAADTIRRDTGAKVKALVADVSSGSEAKRLVDTAVAEYGGLEIVVHNAGGPPAGETLAMTEEQWQKAFEQNLLSFTRIVQAAAPEMKKAGYGRVLTIASSSIKQPIPNLALSNALRAGVWGIAKTLSRELAPQGILVNVIAPGRIDTERIAELDQANAQRIAGTPSRKSTRFRVVGARRNSVRTTHRASRNDAIRSTRTAPTSSRSCASGPQWSRSSAPRNIAASVSVARRNPITSHA